MKDINNQLRDQLKNQLDWQLWIQLGSGISSGVSSIGSSGKNKMTKQESLQGLIGLNRTVRHGWHLIETGPARWGWAAYTAAGHGQWLGRTYKEATQDFWENQKEIKKG